MNVEIVEKNGRRGLMLSVIDAGMPKMEQGVKVVKLEVKLELWSAE
jgi:hypothetical protein